MNRFEWGSVVWGTWFLAFAVLEMIPAVWSRCPWPTLSSYTKDVEGHFVWAAFLICAGLWILNAHLTWRFLPKLWRNITG